MQIVKTTVVEESKEPVEVTTLPVGTWIAPLFMAPWTGLAVIVRQHEDGPAVLTWTAKGIPQIVEYGVSFRCFPCQTVNIAVTY